MHLHSLQCALLVYGWAERNTSPNGLQCMLLIHGWVEQNASPWSPTHALCLWMSWVKCVSMGSLTHTPCLWMSWVECISTVSNMRSSSWMSWADCISTVFNIHSSSTNKLSGMHLYSLKCMLLVCEWVKWNASPNSLQFVLLVHKGELSRMHLHGL